MEGGLSSMEVSLLGAFLQKSPVISGSFAERDLQLNASYAD